MIEFKQIIGRGTRLFEGKNYFTVIDFVNAYHLFMDPEWDGEPIEPIPIDPKDPVLKPTDDPVVDPDDPDNPNEPKQKKLKIRLSDGKTREIQTMSSTYFYVDGKPMGAEDFLKHLFEKIQLPSILGSEEELRKAWSNPLTRRDLLQKLEGAGCPKDDLRELQKCIEAEKCDLFDVLEYIAYAKPPVTREARVETSKDNIYNLLNEAQREFVRYVLRNYIEVGVDELDISKLSTVLTAKYGSLDAAKRELGEVTGIQETFIGFQKYLYAEEVA
ncbi:MAG: restriction endonuclease subunit R, partial [Gammaproteobacteria bacterium]|jgi:type I restriction enzyme, R subunit|nr:restriction endonuclease subunit R [Gammaproteobacteria bacterium]